MGSPFGEFTLDSPYGEVYNGGVLKEDNRMCWKVNMDNLPFKIWKKVPRQVVEKFGFWKEMIEDGGPQSVRFYPGFLDHGLKGKLVGQRSSSLGYQWRVLYRVEKKIVTVVVLDISPHDY